MQNVTEFPDFVRSCAELDLPFAGAKGWVIQNDRQQVAFIEFADDVEVPEHSHEEQWEFVLDGHVELRVNGETTEHQVGSNFFIPAGVPHAATVQAGYKAIIFFNAPDRYQAAR